MTDASNAPEDSADEAYLLGVRDGYENAVQDIDIMLGGDGEYFASTCGDDCADPAAMKARILERWNTRPDISPAHAAKVLLEAFDKVWTKKAAIDCQNTREEKARDGHKWGLVCREGTRAALSTIAEQGDT